jgi:glycosyltransferase involved in cell wall biosynthesis
LKKNQKVRIIVSVTNDLVTDNRVHKVCKSLVGFGFDVILVGRELPSSLQIGERPYRTRRMKLLFRKGPWFYAEFNIRLFLLLLVQRADIFLSNDLDSLPANYLAAKLRRKKLVFDSHEYFSEVPELIGRPRVKRIWKWFEQRIVPDLKYAYTVCDSIAALYSQEYGTSFRVVRNIPDLPTDKPGHHPVLSTDKKIVLYQGAVNIGRGLPQAVSAMKFLDDVLLVIVGTGDIIDDLRNQVAEENLEGRVILVGRVALSEVRRYTACADLGLSIEEDLGLNYRFALTNKFFDYIAAQVPVLVTDLPEMAKLVRHYKIGLIIERPEPTLIAENIRKALDNAEMRAVWKENLKVAATELTWQNEEKVLWEIFSPFLHP